MSQQSLTAFTDDESGSKTNAAPSEATVTDSDPESTERSESGDQWYKTALKRAPDNAEPFADDSCPWCLGPASDFVEHADGRVGCPHCDSIIPTDAEWYQDGEKVCF